MIVLVLTDPDDGRKIIFNWDNVIAIKESKDFRAKATVRVRDGSIYDVRESLTEIENRLQEVYIR